MAFLCNVCFHIPCSIFLYKSIGELMSDSFCDFIGRLGQRRHIGSSKMSRTILSIRDADHLPTAVVFVVPLQNHLSC
jgi:hypothetical protein